MNENQPVEGANASADGGRHHDLGLNPDLLFFQSFPDLGPLVQAWERLDVEGNSMLAALREKVLEEWAAHPELQGPIEDHEVLWQSGNFLEMLCSLKLPIDTIRKPDAMFALAVPMSGELLWTTPAFAQLKLEGVSVEQLIAERNTAGMLILLHRVYGSKLDLSQLPRPKGMDFSRSLTYQPSPEAPVRYFTVKVDNELYRSKGWSITMERPDTVPELTQADIDRILINPFDPDHLRSVFDPRGFEFNGLAFFSAQEVTYRQHIFSLQKELSNRDALRNRAAFHQLQVHLLEFLQVQDMKFGLVLCPHGQDSRRARLTPYLESLRFTEEIEPSKLAQTDPYVKATWSWSPMALCSSAHGSEQVVNDLSNEPALQVLIDQGLNSLVVLPLMHQGRCVALFEVGSPRAHAFDFATMYRLRAVSTYIARSIRQTQESEEERVMAVIKQTCTAIHPSVEWRFQEMARDYLAEREEDELARPTPVVFKDVVPLYGVSDIRNSSTKRNLAIQKDLENQLGLALAVIQTARKNHPRPVLDELAYRIEQHQEAIGEGLNSGDETRIYTFLKRVVESAFDELATLNPSVARQVEAYRSAIDEEVGVVYQKRRSYDESVSMLNETIGAFFDHRQVAAQEMIPHYFEKYKTDGVDHNIYVGSSMLEEGQCSPLDLRNLYLWQLMSMCGVIWLMNDLKPTLEDPLDTAHLILVQSSPLTIRFQMEEKHFTVDGAYNARYEIVKKRIDKACIHGTGERLTQPGQIAIVYTQERESQMYQEFIAYLQHLGYLTDDVIDVLLEDLQGVHGLRAIRVTVAEQAPEGWDPRGQ